MKRMSKTLLAGVLLAGLTVPYPATAADQEVLQKIDSLTRELEALKRQLQEIETKISENENKTEETAAKVEQVEINSLGRWMEIGGEIPGTVY